jgi:UDP-N-acetylglucosamine:LPS N-acetylglucosamine transferase
MPSKPNNFTIQASNVKNLNVGVKKDPVEGRINFTRTWISTRANANEDGTARIDNDMISPGRYQFKIFGDAIDNATQVALEMKVVKKLLINGRFDLALNTSGFPTSNYSINAKAINESVRFDEINLNVPSSGF